MSDRYPNANYPTGYAEADMAKADDVFVNTEGGELTITAAGAGFGPLLEGAVTGANVKGVSFRSGDYPNQPTVEEPEPDTGASIPEPESEGTEVPE